jgi:ribonuclease PH
MRVDGRRLDQLRDIRITPDVLLYAEGSCQVEFGNTKVLCSATLDNKVPPHLVGQGRGWVTAEYAMLPRSSKQRIPRDGVRGQVNGRSQEIQRLIGRSLRTVANLEALGERMFIVDCDVIQADGGTRTAAITGGFVALALAMKRLVERNQMGRILLRDFVAAVSVGIVEGRPVLDLCYLEDAQAEVDMNVVMTAAGRFIELQGTAEKDPFSMEQLHDLLGLAQSGIRQLIEAQKQAIGIDTLGT